MQKVTIIMYHYVRDLNNSRYPRIKGLTTKDFVKQLDFIEKHYTFVRMEDCLECIMDEEEKLPSNPVLITFDDGYVEHFTEVFPVLDERGIQGSFFPPVQSTMEDKVLDVNKIHFILASSDQPLGLLDVLRHEIKNVQSQYSLDDTEAYFDKIKSSEHPYDPAEVVTFKRVLQRELPLEARKDIISALFNKYVGVQEDVFSNELYMKEAQLKTMIRHGMFVGGHGYSHKWLNAISEDEQKIELSKTEGFLDLLGVCDGNKVMCYPYGGFNTALLKMMEKSSFSAGLTIQSGRAALDEKSRYVLGRFDTNEIGI